ncbi:MAG: NADH-quinone oxidoreductase subunit C [Phycisphaerales bacterium]
MSLTPQQIATKLADAFGDAILESHPGDKHPRVHIDAARWLEVAEFLAVDEELRFDYLLCVSGVDYLVDDKLCCVYDLRSMTHGHEFAVKVYTDRAEPVVPSVVHIWPGADWHEREIFDLFGVDFPGHPDLRRILLPEDWVGHPLRKDYEFPREYHGIPGSYELDWQQKPNYPG